MNDRARASIQADLAALNRRRWRGFGAALALCLGAGFGMGFSLGIAPFGGSPVLFSLLLVVLATLAGLSLALAFGLFFPAPRMVRATVVGFAAAGLAAIGGIASEGQAAASRGWACLAEGAELTLAALLIVAVLGQGGRIRRHGPVVAWLGLGAALAVVPALQLACPDRSFEHLMLWHGGVLAAGVVLAVAWRRLAPEAPADDP